jgi:hypothetical protein
MTNTKMSGSLGVIAFLASISVLNTPQSLHEGRSSALSVPTTQNFLNEESLFRLPWEEDDILLNTLPTENVASAMDSNNDMDYLFILDEIEEDLRGSDYYQLSDHDVRLNEEFIQFSIQVANALDDPLTEARRFSEQYHTIVTIFRFDREMSRALGSAYRTFERGDFSDHHVADDDATIADATIRTRSWLTNEVSCCLFCFYYCLSINII